MMKNMDKEVGGHVGEDEKLGGLVGEDEEPRGPIELCNFDI
jgi:hypothetical protein